MDTETSKVGYLRSFSGPASLVVVVAAVVTSVWYFADLERRVHVAEKGIEDIRGSTMASYINRKWCDVGHARRLNETYTNATKLPIELAVSVGPERGVNTCRLEVYINGARVLYQQDNNSNTAKICGAAMTVPPNAQYRVLPFTHNGRGRLVSWWELRPSCPTTPEVSD